jgi:hypothetical protein
VIEINQPGDQICIGRIDLMVHPASDEIAQIGAVQVTVDPDHATPIPITFVNIFCVDISWAECKDFFPALFFLL